MARSTDLKAAVAAEPTGASTLAAAAPLLLLILVDAIGFAMLTPLLASALADGSDAAISMGLSATQRHLVYGIATGLYPAKGELDDTEVIRLARVPVREAIDAALAGHMTDMITVALLLRAYHMAREGELAPALIEAML